MRVVAFINFLIIKLFLLISGSILLLTFVSIKSDVQLSLRTIMEDIKDPIQISNFVDDIRDFG